MEEWIPGKERNDSHVSQESHQFEFLFQLVGIQHENDRQGVSQPEG
jgi:hypothetical protein